MDCLDGRRWLGQLLFAAQAIESCDESPGPVGGVRESRADTRTVSGRRDPQHVPLLQGELRALELRPPGSPAEDGDSQYLCALALSFPH